MKNKIFDLIVANKESEGPTLPIEKEALMKSLSEISREFALEYSEIIGHYVEDLIVMKSIISSSNHPNLVRHIIDGLYEDQLERLRIIIRNMTDSAGDKEVQKIVNAALNVSLPTEESTEKAVQLISLIKAINLEHKEKAKEIANTIRLLKIFCDNLYILGFGDMVEARMRDRLSMLPESDLDGLIKIGVNSLID